MSCDNCKLDLTDKPNQTLELQCHNLRLAYKHVCFEKFLKQERRDAKLLREQYNLTDLRCHFSQISLDDTWKHLATTDASGRALLLGAFRSPLCNHHADQNKFNPERPHCGGPNGSPTPFLGAPHV